MKNWFLALMVLAFVALTLPAFAETPDPVGAVAGPSDTTFAATITAPTTVQALATVMGTALIVVLLLFNRRVRTLAIPWCSLFATTFGNSSSFVRGTAKRTKSPLLKMRGPYGEMKTSTG